MRELKRGTLPDEYRGHPWSRWRGDFGALVSMLGSRPERLCQPKVRNLDPNCTVTIWIPNTLMPDSDKKTHFSQLASSLPQERVFWRLLLWVDPGDILKIKWNLLRHGYHEMCDVIENNSWRHENLYFLWQQKQLLKVGCIFWTWHQPVYLFRY